MRLLEREHELQALDALLSSAAAGSGRALVVAGEAGIGKSALLAATAGRADAFTVLSAAGGALETGFAFGIARQLLLGAAGGLSGAAAPALGLRPVGDRALDAGQQAVSFELQHGLYWLVADLAERSPLLIVVDDVQWADPDSLGFLAFLARRLDDLPVALLLAVREGEPCQAPETLAALRDPATEITPAALSAAAVEQVVRSRVSGAGSELCTACHEVSGGNPFLLGALLDDLPHEAAAVARVRSAGPVAVQRSLLLRLARLGSAAVALAQAVAILDRDAPLITAAALAELEPVAAQEAADALIAARVLEAAHPLRFAHPVQQAAIYADIGLARRSAWHRRAAELLDASAPDRAAMHLLATHPAGDPWVLERLRAAAARALGQGSTAGARALLERALEEATDAETLLALAQVERQSGVRPEVAAARLEQALALAPDDPRIVRERVALHWARGEVAEAIALLDAHAGDLDLVADRAAIAALSAPSPAPPGDDAEQLEGATAAERMLLATLAFRRMIFGTTTGAEVGRLAARALGGGRMLEDLGAGHPATLAVLSTLLVVEHDDDVEAAIEHAAASAPAEAAALRSLSARVELFHGDLRAAEAAAREALEIARPAGLAHIVRFALPTLVQILVERDALDAAEAELVEAEQFRHDSTLWLLLQARAALRRARGDFTGAAADTGGAHAQRPAGSVLGAATHALALHAVGETDEAVRLASASVAHARRWGVPSTLGMALRVHGLVSGDLHALRAAVAALEPTPRRLEHARALVDLGAALRRANHRAEAREPLAAGMELAHRCGAAALAARAREELVACGARPRRLLRTGVDALTPSELRVAQLAAAGRSNREIAQALFVTRKTVETHLGGIYRKLGVNSRERLADKLQDPPPEAKRAPDREAVAP